jgi:hypothetical protein
MSARTARDIPRVTERAPQLVIPRELEDIVAQLTRRRPGERHAGAREVIDALDRVRVGPEARLPTEPIVRRRRWRWLAAVAAAALVGGAGTWYAVDAGWGAAPPPAPSGIAAAAAAAPSRPAAAPGDRAADPEAIPAAAAGPATPAPPVAAVAPAAAGDPAPAPQDLAPARHRHHPRPSHAAAHPEPSVRAEPAVEARRVAVSPLLPAPAPPPAPPPAAELRARIAHVDVNGSLSPAAVQRAVERRMSAIGRCKPASPAIVVAHFRIGEARRAQAVTAAGAAGDVTRCIANALAEVRTEQAPDVGDVDVTVRIAFAVKT